MPLNLRFEFSYGHHSSDQLPNVLLLLNLLHSIYYRLCSVSFHRTHILKESRPSLWHWRGSSCLIFESKLDFLRLLSNTYNLILTHGTNHAYFSSWQNVNIDALAIISLVSSLLSFALYQRLLILVEKFHNNWLSSEGLIWIYRVRLTRSLDQLLRGLSWLNRVLA